MRLRSVLGTSFCKNPSTRDGKLRNHLHRKIILSSGLRLFVPIIYKAYRSLAQPCISLNQSVCLSTVSAELTVLLFIGQFVTDHVVHRDCVV